MKIDLTEREAQFVVENLSQLSVSLSEPNAVEMVFTGRAVIEKIISAFQSGNFSEKTTTAIMDVKPEQ